MPNRGYRLLILRVHTPRLKEADGTLGDEAALVTSDAYDPQKPVSKKLAPYLVRVYALTDWPLREMYGVTDGFVQTLMEGNLQGATVILTGCSGLRTEKLARAFVSRGAKEVIGWDGLDSDRLYRLLRPGGGVGAAAGRAAARGVSRERGVPTHPNGGLSSMALYL